MKSSTQCFYVKTKILVDFQICIRVLLIWVAYDQIQNKGIPEKWDLGLGTRKLYVGPETLYLGPRTHRRDPRLGAYTWDPGPGTLHLGPGTLYVGTLTQYLYVERGTHTYYYHYYYFYYCYHYYYYYYYYYYYFPLRYLCNIYLNLVFDKI